MKAQHTLFHDLFPPPRFLEMPSVGLDISDDAIRFVEIKRKGSCFELGMHGEAPLPKEVVEQGYISNMPKFIEVLSSLQKKYNLHFVKASLPEQKSYLFKIEIPMMEEIDIRGALQFKIEENVPVSLADAIYDYRIIKHPEPGDKTLHLSVTVVHKKVVSSYLEALKSAKLVPVELQIESQAIAHVAVPNTALVKG